MADGAGMFLVTTDDMQAVSDVVPMSAEYFYPPEFPGYVGSESVHRPTQAYHPHDMPFNSGYDTPSGNIDRTSHGEMGEVDRNAYYLGPVDPNKVENFELMGEVLPGQRRPEYGDGVVGRYDNNEYTTLQVAQQMSDNAYDEASLMDILLGGTHG